MNSGPSADGPDCRRRAVLVLSAEANTEILKLSFDKIGQSFDWVANLSVEGRQAAAALAAIGVLGTSAFVFKQLFSGFGLSTSAGLLDKAAIDLMAAAGVLGGKGAATAAGAGAAGAGAAAVGSAAAIMKGGSAAAAIGALSVLKKDSATEDQPLRTWFRSMLGIEDDKEAAPWMPGGSWNKGAPPELRGKMEGQAKITIDIPGLASRTVDVPLKGTVSANGPGSLGTSSPDAMPGGVP